MLTPVELLRHYVVKGKDVSVDAQGFVRFVGSNIAYPKNTKTNIVATSQNPNSNEREYVNENCYWRFLPTTRVTLYHHLIQC